MNFSFFFLSVYGLSSCTSRKRRWGGVVINTCTQHRSIWIRRWARQMQCPIRASYREATVVIIMVTWASSVRKIIWWYWCSIEEWRTIWACTNIKWRGRTRAEISSRWSITRSDLQRLHSRFLQGYQLPLYQKEPRRETKCYTESLHH